MILREVYDDSGLLHTEYVEVEDFEETLEEKEAKLIQIYNEIQELKNKQN